LQRGCHPLDHLGEGPHVERLIDVDHTCGGVFRRVHRNDRNGHRVPDHDRTVDAQRGEGVMQAVSDPIEGLRRSWRLAVPRQIHADALETVGEASSDRTPGGAAERQAVHEHDYRPGPLLVVGEGSGSVEHIVLLDFRYTVP